MIRFTIDYYVPVQDGDAGCRDADLLPGLSADGAELRVLAPRHPQDAHRHGARGLQVSLSQTTI